MGTIPTDVHPEYKTRKGGGTMRALAWFGPRDVRIVDAPIPEITEPDDVILKVTGLLSVVLIFTSITERSSPCKRAIFSATRYVMASSN